jgi:hypothetical protein
LAGFKSLAWGTFETHEGGYGFERFGYRYWGYGFGTRVRAQFKRDVPDVTTAAFVQMGGGAAVRFDRIQTTRRQWSPMVSAKVGVVGGLWDDIGWFISGGYTYTRFDAGFGVHHNPAGGEFGLGVRISP